MSAEEPNQEQMKLPLTLKQFIDDNQRLISVVGVFGALLLFSNQLTRAHFSGFVIFGLFTCLTVLWFELHAQFPKENSGVPTTQRLRWFKWGIEATLIFVFGYWLLLFEESYGSAVIVWPIMFGFLIGMNKLAEKTGFARRFLSRAKALPYVYAFIMLMLGSVIGTQIAKRVHKPAHEVMNELRSSIRTGALDTTRVVK